MLKCFVYPFCLDMKVIFKKKWHWFRIHVGNLTRKTSITTVKVSGVMQMQVDLRGHWLSDFQGLEAYCHCHHWYTIIVWGTFRKISNPRYTPKPYCQFVFCCLQTSIPSIICCRESCYLFALSVSAHKLWQNALEDSDLKEVQQLSAVKVINISTQKQQIWH